MSLLDDEAAAPFGPSAFAEDPGPASWLLGLAFAACAFAVGLLLLTGVVANVAGYLCASVVAFSCVAMFRRRSQRRLAEVGVALTRTIQWSTTGLLVAGFVTSGLHAWFIAKALA